MSLNTIVKETGVESAVAFGVGSLINAFISDEHASSENWTRSVVEVIGGLIANGLAANAYLDYARSHGDSDLMKMVPYMLTLASVQPKLVAKIQGLANMGTSQWKHLVSPPPGTPVEQKSPAATANQTRIIQVKPGFWGTK